MQITEYDSVKECKNLVNVEGTTDGEHAYDVYARNKVTGKTTSWGIARIWTILKDLQDLNDNTGRYKD